MGGQRKLCSKEYSNRTCSYAFVKLLCRGILGKRSHPKTQWPAVSGQRKLCSDKYLKLIPSLSFDPEVFLWVGQRRWLFSDALRSQERVVRTFVLIPRCYLHWPDRSAHILKHGVAGRDALLYSYARVRIGVLGCEHITLFGFEIFLVKIVSFEKVLPADRGLGRRVLGCELLFL